MTYLPRIALLCAAALILAGAPLRADEPKQQEKTLQPWPGWKITLKTPPGWEANPLPRDGPYQSVWADSLTKPARLALDFEPNSIAYESTRQGIDELLHHRYDTPAAKAALVDMESKSGLGGYAIFTNKKSKGAGQELNDFHYTAAGLFVTHGMAVIFSLEVDDLKSAEFQQGLKFIEEGILVDYTPPPGEVAAQKYINVTLQLANAAAAAAKPDTMIFHLTVTNNTGRQVETALSQDTVQATLSAVEDSGKQDEIYPLMPPGAMLSSRSTILMEPGGSKSYDIAVPLANIPSGAKKFAASISAGIYTKGVVTSRTRIESPLLIAPEAPSPGAQK